jgi:hypothetical protein
LDAVYALRRFSDGVRAATADELIELTWKDIEAAYHPATYQLGGPHSRAYGDNLLDYAASLKQYLFLALNGDYPLAPLEINHSHDNAFAIIRSLFEVGEKPDLRLEKPRFRQVQLPPAEPAKPIYLRQYSTVELHVGSVSEQDESIQRRNVLAYWSKPPGCGVGFMKGYFRRGEKEERAARFFSQQKGPAVLAAIRARARYLDAVSGEPNYRLVFNERAQWSVDWLKPGSGPLTVSEMLVYVQSFSLPESLGTPTWRRAMGEYTTEVTTDLIWTWSDASKAPQWVIAGFVLSFRKVGEGGGAVTGCRFDLRTDELALYAKAGEELLELRVPLI